MTAEIRVQASEKFIEKPGGPVTYPRRIALPERVNFLEAAANIFRVVRVETVDLPGGKIQNVKVNDNQFIVGGIILILCGLLLGGRMGAVSASAIGILVYLAFVSAVAYSLWGLLLKYNPVSKVAVFGFMNPVFGVILSAWLLDEREQAFGVLSIISLALVCVGIYIVNKRNENC